MSSPPRIASATLDQITGAAGVTVTVAVEWTGEPRVQPRFQWFNDTLRIRGVTGGSYTPATDMPNLRCRVRVDNGRGAATAVAVLMEAPTATTPSASSVYEAGVFDEGVFV